jgi:hypothetical protein
MTQSLNPQKIEGWGAGTVKFQTDQKIAFFNAKGA